MPLTVMSQSDSKTLCLHYTGLITTDDIEGVFGADFETWRNQKEINGLYLEFSENFQGWTEEAAATSLQFIMSCLDRLRKIAHVNAPDSRRLLSSMLDPICTAEVRHFETGEEAEALTWVKT